MTTTHPGVNEIDTPDGLIMTTLDIDVHAEALADMWNASDANWPGTWTGGVPETAENVRRTYERQEAIETFLCMDGDVVAGFCKVMPDLDEPGVDYVALVNVPPSHQKRGLARRLLQRANALAVERGSYRLDLHTWSANLDAVPLYKKVGFMWMPDTDLHMLNFMPAILRLDAAREFFATRDWYRVLRRPLDQVPDEDRWEDMKVFTYRFADSPDDPADVDPSLVVRVDREARAICAVETTAYSVAATAARLDPPRGGEVTLRWTVTNRGDAPLPVTVVATGTNELLIDHRGSAAVAPGATETLEASCRIAPDAKDVKTGKPVPSVKSVLLLGDEVVELSTGLRPRPALEITTWPAKITLLPGQRRKVHIRLRNRLPQTVGVDLRASGADGLELNWTRQELSADGEGWTGAELEVAVPPGRSAAYPLSLSAVCDSDGSSLRVEPEPRHVFAVAPGTVVAAKEKESLRIENDHFRALLDERGATLRLADPLTGDGRSAFGAMAGPPFSPSEFRTLDYDLDLERTAHGVAAVATARSKRWPGFVFRCRFGFTSSPVIELSSEAENGEADPRKVQIMQITNHGGGRRVVPFAAGLIAGDTAADFPGADDNESKKPEKFVERWSATENRDGYVIGCVWGDDLEEVVMGGMAVLSRSQEVAPQSRLSVEPLWLYCGPGRWQAVRDLWRRREGIVVPKDAAPEEPQDSVRVGVEAAPWIAGPGFGPASVLLEHGATWPIEGTATLIAPDGWTLDKTEVDLSEVTWQKPAVVAVQATAPAGRAVAATVRVEVRAKEFDTDLEIPVIAFAEAGQPSVQRLTEADRELWRVTAGRSELAIAPDHAGSTVSWKVDGVEQLASPYPETDSIGWLLPWHGGLMPLLMMGNVSFPGRLWSETFAGEEIEEKDSRGLLWRGVKVSAESTHEDSRGIGIEAVTLACSGAPVLKSTVRLVNRTGSLQTPTFGSFAFCSPGGDREHTVVHSDRITTKPSDRYTIEAAGTWVAAVNGQTGSTVLMCSNKELGVAKFGPGGGHFMNFRSPEVLPGGTAESVSYLVAAESLEAAKPWRALVDLG